MPRKAAKPTRWTQNRTRTRHSVTLAPAEWERLEAIRARRGLRSISAAISALVAEATSTHAPSS